MAEHKSKPTSPLKDLLWFLGILFLFYLMWVAGGGPERAMKNPPSPTTSGPYSRPSQTE